MTFERSPAPEQLYFDVEEISRQEAPLRIAHKYSLSIAPYELFVHLLGVGSELSAPRWAVALEVVEHGKVRLPVTRLGSQLYEDIEAARQAGMAQARRWVEENP